MDINKLAKEIYEQNKAVGWWDDPDRCIYQTLQLVSTEIAEATEAERKDLMDDHLPHRKGGEVELADALIRVLDLGGRYGWKYRDDEHVGFDGILNVATSKGGQHFAINFALILLGRDLEWGETESNIIFSYSRLINTILKVGELNNYDIESAMMEKLKYNKQRADHKRENRAKAGGKAF